MSRRKPELGSLRKQHQVAFAVESGMVPGDRATLQLVAGAVEYGKGHGWQMRDLAPWQNHIPDFAHPDGIIICLGHTQLAAANRLCRTVPAAVFLASPYTPEPCPGVNLQGDSVRAGEECAAYMLGRGFRNFAICGYSTDWNQPLTTFEARVVAEGSSCIRIGSLSVQPGEYREKRLEFQRTLARQTLPLAIFCLNDRLASRVCSWCLDMGLEIPEQVTILGVDNDLVHCECSPVPISSLDWNTANRGAEGAKLLQRMMDGEEVPNQTVLVPPGEIVTRRSTDILAIPDLASARALRYIWDHYRESIGPTEIAAECAISRRNLDRHFLTVLGRTVNSELNRYRLMKACELLTTTSIMAAEVALQTGFSTPQYFTQRFKRAFGLTPIRYREREHVTLQH